MFENFSEFSEGIRIGIMINSEKNVLLGGFVPNIFQTQVILVLTKEIMGL